MATWEDVISTAKELASSAGRKVADVADYAKLKVKIAENEHAIEDVMEAIGRLVYESRVAEAPLEEGVITELCRQADELYAANERLQEDVDHRCGRSTCTCGTANPQGAIYCNSCGKPLFSEDRTEEVK